MEDGKLKKRKKFPFPDTYVLIVCLMLLALILTYLIPSGTFDRVTEGGREIVQPGT